jgi:hypothetical protein
MKGCFGGDPEEALPEYAGKRLRYALIFLELLDRKPVEVLQIQYAYIFFDAKGRIDRNEFMKQARLTLEIIESFTLPQTRAQIIFAGHRFARKRLQDQYQWNPNSELESAIVKAAPGKG